MATLQGSVPSVANYCRAMPYSGLVSIRLDTKFRESQFVFVDASFVEMFPPVIVHGSLEGTMNAPFQVTLTEQKARQYFGNENPVGQVISYESEDNHYDFTVVAVVKDLSSQSHFNIDFLATFSSLDKIIPWHKNWFYPQTYTYVQLEENARKEDIELLAQKSIG